MEVTEHTEYWEQLRFCNTWLRLTGELCWYTPRTYAGEQYE